MKPVYTNVPSYPHLGGARQTCSYTVFLSAGEWAVLVTLSHLLTNLYGTSGPCVSVIAAWALESENWARIRLYTYELCDLGGKAL